MEIEYFGLPKSKIDNLFSQPEICLFLLSRLILSRKNETLESLELIKNFTKNMPNEVRIRNNIQFIRMVADLALIRQKSQSDDQLWMKLLAEIEQKKGQLHDFEFLIEDKHRFPHRLIQFIQNKYIGKLSLRREVHRKDKMQRLPSIEQLIVLNDFFGNDIKHIAIEAPPGTGKTFLATSICSLTSEQGRSVLYLCFNKAKVSYVKKLFFHSENITISSYNNIKDVENYDLVVIDEAHDYSSDILKEINFDKKCNKLILLFDFFNIMNQNLESWKSTITPKNPREFSIRIYTLGMNFRSKNLWIGQLATKYHKGLKQVSAFPAENFLRLDVSKTRKKDEKIQYYICEETEMDNTIKQVIDITLLENFESNLIVNDSAPKYNLLIDRLIQAQEKKDRKKTYFLPPEEVKGIESDASILILDNYYQSDDELKSIFQLIIERTRLNLKIVTYKKTIADLKRLKLFTHKTSEENKL